MQNLQLSKGLISFKGITNEQKKPGYTPRLTNGKDEVIFQQDDAPKFIMDGEPWSRNVRKEYQGIKPLNSASREMAPDTTLLERAGKFFSALVQTVKARIK